MICPSDKFPWQFPPVAINLHTTSPPGDLELSYMGIVDGKWSFWGLSICKFPGKGIAKIAKNCKVTGRKRLLMITALVNNHKHLNVDTHHWPLRVQPHFQWLIVPFKYTIGLKHLNILSLFTVLGSLQICSDILQPSLSNLHICKSKALP